MRGELVQPSGLRLCLDVIDPAHERALVQAISSLALEPMVIRDNPSRRQVAHFGVSYAAATRTTSAGPAIPKVFAEAIALSAAALAADDIRFEELLVTDYPPGSGIGRHRDAPAFGVVLGISLLSPCTLQFERRSGVARQVWEQLLPPRSAYLLMGESRWDWRHGIHSVTRRRMSLTARELRGGLALRSG